MEDFWEEFLESGFAGRYSIFQLEHTCGLQSHVFRWRMASDELDVVWQAVVMGFRITDGGQLPIRIPCSHRMGSRFFRFRRWRRVWNSELQEFFFFILTVFMEKGGF